MKTTTPVQPPQLKSNPSEYDIQAHAFLLKWGIDLKVVWASTDCPPFCDDSKHIHGDKHQVTLKRPLTQKRITFPFWNSFNDAQNGEAPSPYDVLASIGSDLTCPDDFEEFCTEYGYEEDSRKAHATWRRVSAFVRKLHGFFDNEEMQADLQNIR